MKKQIVCILVFGFAQNSSAMDEPMKVIEFKWAAENRLLFAANINNIAEVTQLIEEGEDVNKDEQGVTALIIAAQEGCLEIVKTLLVHNANVNAQTACGDKVTALIQASSRGYTDIVQLLCENRADVDKANMQGATPLTIAAEKGHLRVVSILLDHNANVNHQATGLHSITALQQAADNDHVEVVELLLKKGAQVDLQNAYGCTALLHAAGKGYGAIVDLLLKNKAGAEIAEKQGISPLIIAANNGHAKVVQSLLKYQADVNTQAVGGHNVCALDQAAQEGHTEVVRMLLEHGASVNLCHDNKHTPLIHAAENGHLAVVNLLCEGRADVNATGFRKGTALRQAAQNGHEDIVKLLLEKKSEIDKADDAGGTPLFTAVKNGHLSIVRMLLLNNACVPTQAAGYHNASALHAVGESKRDHLAIAEELLTAISNAERERMRNSYAVNFAIKRMVGGTKDIRLCITRELVRLLVQERMQQATHLLSMVLDLGLTAHDHALINGFVDVADLVDIHNQESLKKIRKLIIANVLCALRNK